MPQVQMPDGTVVEMPDELTPELATRLRTAMAAPAAKSKAPAAKVEAPWYQGAVDVAKNVGSGILRGAMSLPDALAEYTAAREAEMPEIQAKRARLTAAGYPVAPTVAERQQQSAALNAQLFQPQTQPQKYVQEAAKGVGGAMLIPGGGMATTLLGGAGSGLGSEAAAQTLGEGPLQRIAGGLAGGLAGGVAANLGTNKAAMAREALEGLKPEDLARARANMQTAQAAGVPVNLGQALERPSNVDKIVEALAGNRYGTKVQEQLRAQPVQSRMGLEQEMLGMPGEIRTPQVVANNMQDVATAAIDKARQGRTAAWEAQRAATQAKIFGQASSPQVTQQALADVAERLETMAAARPNTEVANQLRTLRAGMADAEGNFLTDPKQLNEVLKEAATKLKSPDLASKGVDAGQSRFLARTIDEIRTDLGPAFKPIREANITYKQITDDVINPLKKSVVGRMAGRRGEVPDAEAVRSKITSLFDQGTVPGARSSDILKLEKDLRGIKAGEAGAGVDGSAAFQDSVKTWMGEKISDAVRPVGGRLNEDLPKRLAQAFSGPETRSQGFRDMMVGLARSQGLRDNALYPGMEKFLKVVGMASRRPGGAAGAGARELDEIAGQSAVSGVGRFSAITPLRQPILKWMEFLKADAYRAMDNLLTTPEGVDMLQKLGRERAMSPAAQTALATFLGTQASVPQEGEAPQE